MFWLCYQEHRGGTKRLSRSWIVEADIPPDEPDENGERPYPFNGMGGHIAASYDTEEEALRDECTMWAIEEGTYEPV